MPLFAGFLMTTVTLAGVGVAEGDDMFARASAVSLAAAGPLDRAGCSAAPEFLSVRFRTVPVVTRLDQSETGVEC